MLIRPGCSALLPPGEMAEFRLKSAPGLMDESGLPGALAKGQSLGPCCRHRPPTPGLAAQVAADHPTSRKLTAQAQGEFGRLPSDSGGRIPSRRYEFHHSATRPWRRLLAQGPPPATAARALIYTGSLLQRVAGMGHDPFHLAEHGDVRSYSSGAVDLPACAMASIVSRREIDRAHPGGPAKVCTILGSPRTALAHARTEIALGVPGASPGGDGVLAERPEIDLAAAGRAAHVSRRQFPCQFWEVPAITIWIRSRRAAGKASRGDWGYVFGQFGLRKRAMAAGIQRQLPCPHWCEGPADHPTPESIRNAAVVMGDLIMRW